MEQNAHSVNSGFTLIEVLVAIVIMTVGIMGLLMTVNMALLHNMSNQLRSDAVLVIDEQMALEMAKPFDLVSTTTNTRSISRNLYTASKNYTVTKTGTSITANTKSVNIAAAWTYKGQNYSHSVNSLISNFNN